MTTYKLVNIIDFLGNQKTVIALGNSNGSISWIPMSDDNTDYQAYLKWVAEGNTPEPADE
jgi:hypothetical protein